MLKVLIPTSGMGSRIGELTDYTNKALVRVGTKPSLSHIFEAYPPQTEFVIMLGYKGALVREFVQIAHPTLKVTYIDIEMAQGNMGFLPALCAEQNKLTGPFIFHACDTLAFPIPSDFLEWESNAILGYPNTDKDTSQYRTIRHMCGQVENIQDKGELPFPQDLIHIGIVKFEDSKAFWNAAHTLIEHNSTDKTACDTQVIEVMLKAGFDFRVFTVQTWYDTGNITTLEKARDALGTDGAKLLEKVDQAIYLFEDRIVKFFADDGMVEPRVHRAKILCDAVPRITGHSPHFFAYERAKGQIGTEMTVAQMRDLLPWLHSTLWQDIHGVNWHNFQQTCYDFYFKKTQQRLKMFYQKTGIKDKPIIINGMLRSSVAELLQKINWRALSQGIRTAKLHGDLHPSNILISPEGGFKLLDWRESFGGDIDCGDVYYDLAKLNHGLLVSHDIVDQNLFTINIENDHIDVDILRKQKLIECQTYFFDWCRTHGYKFYHIKILTALIYLNIAALHHRPYDKFLYYFGHKLLSDFFEGPDSAFK